MAHSRTSVTPRTQTLVADATDSVAVTVTEEELRTRYKTRLVTQIPADSPCIPILKDVYDRRAQNPYFNPTHKVELKVEIPELGITVVTASRSRLVAHWLDVIVLVNPQEEAEESYSPRLAYYTIRLNTLEVFEAEA